MWPLQFPLVGSSDFSSFLLQAQASKAKVVALANAGVDTTNAIKQAQEFGLAAGGQTVLPMLAFITDIKAMALQNAAGLRFTAGFYWDRTDGSGTNSIGPMICRSPRSVMRRSWKRSSPAMWERPAGRPTRCWIMSRPSPARRARATKATPPRRSPGESIAYVIVRLDQAG